MPTTDESDSKEIKHIAEVARKLVSYVNNIIVTLGSDGVLIARKATSSDSFLSEPKNNNIEIRHYPAERVEGIINVSGAGDSFASGLILSTLKGLSEEKSVSVGFSAAKAALQSSSTVSDKMFIQNLEKWKNCAMYHDVKIE